MDDNLALAEYLSVVVLNLLREPVHLHDRRLARQASPLMKTLSKPTASLSFAVRAGASRLLAKKGPGMLEVRSCEAARGAKPSLPKIEAENRGLTCVGTATSIPHRTRPRIELLEDVKEWCMPRTA